MPTGQYRHPAAARVRVAEPVCHIGLLPGATGYRPPRNCDGHAEDWRRDPFEHGYFVVAAAAYLAWTRRERLASLSARPCFLALPSLGLASLLWLLSRLTGTGVGSTDLPAHNVHRVHLGGPGERRCANAAVSARHPGICASCRGPACSRAARTHRTAAVKMLRLERGACGAHGRGDLYRRGAGGESRRRAAASITSSLLSPSDTSMRASFTGSGVTASPFCSERPWFPCSGMRCACTPPSCWTTLARPRWSRECSTSCTECSCSPR